MSRSDEALHQPVRRWLCSGALFPAPQDPRPGIGSVARCAVCSAPIPQGDVEYEVPCLGGETTYTHRRCYLIWLQPLPGASRPATVVGPRRKKRGKAQPS